MSYHLRNYAIQTNDSNFIDSIPDDLKTVIEKCLQIPKSMSPLCDFRSSITIDDQNSLILIPNRNCGQLSNNNNNDQTSIDNDNHTLNLSDFEYKINPSSFGAFDCGRNLILKFENFLKRQSASRKNNTDLKSLVVNLHSESVVQGPKSTHKLVTTGIHCLSALLIDLSEKDPQSCCTALNSLYSLLNSVQIEELSSEPKSLIDNIYQTLISLKKSSFEEISSLAASCMVALTVAYGSTNMYVDCASQLICIDNNWTTDESKRLFLTVPANYMALYKHSLKTIYRIDNIVNSWSNINVSLQHNFFMKIPLSEPCLAKPMADSSPQAGACALASDGHFIYLINMNGLFKLGSGFSGSKLGCLYAQNPDISVVEDPWLAICAGSLYLKQKHSTRLIVLDCETLSDVGEILLTTQVAQGILCSDGSQINLFTIQNSTSTLTVTPLNDNFIAQQQETTSLLLTEPSFILYNDNNNTFNSHNIMNNFDRELVRNFADIIHSRTITLVITKNGHIFFNGHGRSLNLHDTGDKWRELMIPDKVKSINLSPDCETLLLVSQSGHVYVCGTRNFEDNGSCRSKNKPANAGIPRKFNSPNNRNIKQAVCNNDSIALVTDNGKLYIHGKQSLMCNPETHQVIGLENLHIKKVAMGKTHTVVFTSQGHVYTFGSNNFGQCGRTDMKHLLHAKDSDSEKSKTDDEASTADNLLSSPAITTSQRKAVQLCAPSSHVWKKEMSTICTACGLCSNRGFECVFSKNRIKGALCGCGIGISGCSKCGICRSCGRQYGASGSEIDTGSDGQPFTLLTPYRVVLSKSNDLAITDVACGNYHTILRATDGSVITFGSNRHGQLGIGDTNHHPGPQNVVLPASTKAKEVYAGANHCIIVCQDGTVCSFGKHHNGQLGRDSGQMNWFAKPGFVDGFTAASKKKVTLISARNDSTLLRFEQGLISTKNTYSGLITANSQQIMIMPKKQKSSVKSSQFYVLTKTNDDSKKLAFEAGHVAPDIHLSCFTLDPLYNVLWCYNSNTSEIQSFVPWNIDGQAKINDICLHNSEFWIPTLKQSSVSDIQIGFNMLSTFLTLLNDKIYSNTADDSVDHGTEAVKKQKEKMSQVTRFQNFGGGWGYAAQSVEAIQFCCSKDVNLHGLGLYGGRGEYVVRLKLLRVIGDNHDDRHVETVTEADEVAFECGPREIEPIMFAKPVPVKAGRWHVAWASIKGSSSDCGSNGQQNVVNSDGVVFYFKESSFSNNGTDVNIGQIPTLLYSIAKNEESRVFANADTTILFTSSLTMNINDLSARFFFTITPSSYIALLKMIKLAVESVLFPALIKNDPDQEYAIEQAASIVIINLKILNFFNLLLYAPANLQATNERKEFAACIENMFQIIVALMHTVSIETGTCANVSQPVKLMLEQCQTVICQCFSIFFPTQTLVAHYLATLMKSEQRVEYTLNAFLIALSTSDSLLSILTQEPMSADSENRYPLLASVMKKSRKIQTANASKNLDFTILLQFLTELVFEPSAGTDANLQVSSSNLLLRLCQELVEAGGEENQDGKKSALLQTPKRFLRQSSLMNWEYDANLSPDAISFQVDRNGVNFYGAGIYIGNGTYLYTLELLINKGDSCNDRWCTLEKITGQLDSKDVSMDVAQIKLLKPVKLEPNRIYTIRLFLSGGKTWSGDSGMHIVNGHQGMKVSFLACLLSQNGTTVSRGQIPFIIYSLNDNAVSHAVNNETASKWFLLMLKHFTSKVYHIIKTDCDALKDAIWIIVPKFFGYLNRFLDKNPSYSLDILNCFEDVFAAISVHNSLHRSHLDCTPGFGTCSSVVESEHPYKTATVSTYTVQFNSTVKFMVLEFDQQCCTSQAEDLVQVYLKSNHNFHIPIASYSGSKWSNNVLFLPGNGLLFTIESASSSAVESSQMYGFKCTIRGYEVDLLDALLWFELEIVNLCSKACQTIIAKSHKLTFRPTSPDLDAKLLEDEAFEVIRDHMILMSKGLNLSHRPTFQEIMSGKLPLNSSSSEMRFLHDCINASGKSAGGKLMRWLMTEPYIDPCNCEMLLEMDELFNGKPLLITVVTKDQYGRISFNDKIAVEVWITHAENCIQDVSILSNMDKSKMKSIVYQPTYLNRARYVAITMMKSAQSYSFEELRLANQSCSIAKEVLSVRCQQDGFYLAAWTPKRSGNYRIECRVDTFLIDQTQTVDIKNGLVTKKPVNTHLCQTMKCSTAACNATNTRGVRIRMQPDLASNCIGNVPPGATLFFTQEVENKDGVWLKLSEESTALFCQGFSKRNAVWCLQYHKHLKKVLLMKEMETNRDKNDASNSATMQSIVMVCEENYQIVAQEMQAGVPIRATPSKFARIFGFINVVDVVSSVGWVQNSEGIWIQLNRAALAKFVQCGSVGALNGDGYCLVQENAASTAYFERIISPSTSVSAFNQKLQEDNDDAKQASTQTSPSSEEKVKLHISKARIRHEYQSRMKPTMKVPPQNTIGKSHIPYAMETTIADCIRSVFATILWNEQLIYDAMACAAFLKFHPELQRLQFRNELTVTSNIFGELAEFNVPISLQILLALFKEISSAVSNVIEKHLILPSPPMALKTSTVDRKCSLTNTQVYFCELCERWFPSLITAHMSIAHPGCGRHAGGQGYNSLGKLTTGWTGNCGDGGTSYLTWYLLCQKCREHYLIKTESQRQKVKKLRARSFRISTGNTEPQTILKNNAVFLLQLNYANHSPNDKEVLNDLVGSKEAKTIYSEENLDYLFAVPSSFNPSLQGSSNSSQITRKVSKPFDPMAALMPYHSVAPYASDPGPKRSRADDDVSLPSSEPSVHPVEATKRSRIGSIFNATEFQLLLASPSNALKIIAQNRASPSSIHTTCQRPVMAFLIQHHNLLHLRDAMHLATSRAVLFEKAFHTLNWLLRNTTNPLSVNDILWHFVNALHQQEVAQLIHPMKLTFLSGHFRSHMMAKFHTILNTIASILKNYEHISLETLRCCLHAWMFNFLPEDQDLILKSQIIDTLSRIVSESNNDGSRTVDTADQNKSIIEIHKMEDLTSIMTIETVSHPAMVPYLLDKNTDTFWESGDEEKAQTKIIKVRSSRSGSKFAHIGIFVDNVKDHAHKVEHVCFAEQYEKEYRKIKSRLIDSDFRGWIKCSINQNCSLILIELRSSDHHVRLRQLQVLGRSPQLPETSVATFKHSPSIFMHFDTITSDAFELFRLIASFAFGNESTKDEELQQQVLNILFSKSQLNSLQSYVSTQIVVALEREISLLKDKIKRNYSYCLGLISMLLQISNAKFRKLVNLSANNQTLLASLTELVLFSPENIQGPTLELLEYIFGFFDVKMINDVNHVIDSLLLSMIKAGSFQLRSIPIDITRQINVRESMINDPSMAWHLNRTTSLKIAQEIRKLLSLCGSSSEYGPEWSNVIKRRVAECLTDPVILNSSYKDSSLIVKSKAFWLAMASLAVVQHEDWLNCSPSWRQTVANIRATIAYCENHDDGSTIAAVACDQCGNVNLCGDCSATMHLPRAKRGHVLRQLATAGASLQIVIHETGCRLKTDRMAILVDYTSLNGLIDFRKDIQSNMNSSTLLLGVPKCRFCGFNNATGLHDTCYEQECQEKLAMACKKVLACGHLCGGIVDEKLCLPCLKCHNSPYLRQDAEDICVICFTDTLSSAPSIQLLSCSHVFHYKCCSTVLLKRWHSARITFSFMDCPVCKLEMAHESLDHLLKPLLELKDDVGKKATLRLTYDGMSNVKEEEKLAYALKRYAYYQCYKCGRAYFGGEAQCQVNNDVNYDPSELLCGACSNVSQAQICPQHGTDFLEYKCRYCCSMAVFFCFGTTHFCSQCHDEFQRLINMPKNQMPQCPVGSKFTMLTPGSCPLKVKHPPTGEEYALGCGICRNINTF